MRRLRMTFVTIAVLTGAAAIPAQAQSVADFYRGKTVNVLIGVAVGGEYDLQARLVARGPRTVHRARARLLRSVALHVRQRLAGVHAGRQL